jgi:hypothetical protein
MDETQRRAARVLRLRDGNERWGYGMGAEVGAGSAARRGRRRRSEVWCGVGAMGSQGTEGSSGLGFRLDAADVDTKGRLFAAF